MYQNRSIHSVANYYLTLNNFFTRRVCKLMIYRPLFVTRLNADKVSDVAVASGFSLGIPELLAVVGYQDRTKQKLGPIWSAVVDISNRGRGYITTL